MKAGPADGEGISPDVAVPLLGKDIDYPFQLRAKYEKVPYVHLTGWYSSELGIGGEGAKAGTGYCYSRCALPQV
jgi:hypothetical protein